MAKDNKYKNLDPEDLLRYSADGLSDEERHALEREAQKDPFVEEALEGLETLSAEQSGEDLSRLRSRLIKRITGRKKLGWVPIAASVAVILTLGTIYLTLFTDKLNKLDQTVAETESTEDPREKSFIEEPETIDEIGVTPAESPALVSEEEKKRDEEKKGAEEEILAREESTGDIRATDQEVSGKSITEPEQSGQSKLLAEDAVAEPEIIVSDQLVMEDESMISEAEVMEEDSFSFALVEESGDMDVAASEIEAASQARRSVSSQPAAMGAASDEIAGLNTSKSAVKKETIAGFTSVVSSIQEIPDSVPAMPEGGLENFNRYIQENTILPDVYADIANASVILSFELNADGRPENIIIEESTDATIGQEALRLLQGGPAWSRAYENGTPVASRNRLNINFIR